MITEEMVDDQPIYAAVSWKATEFGDFISGKVTFLNFEYQTKNGNKMLLKINADKVISGSEEQVLGLFSVWEKAQLRSAIIIERVQVGDNIGIRYVDEAEAKGGQNPMKRFKVKAERTEESEGFIQPAINVNDVPTSGDVGDGLDAETAQILRDTGAGL